MSEPRRDAAIEGLEPCRKAAAKPKKADLERENAAMRKEVALALEKQFDAAHPDQRGHLVATVKGDVLDVDMPKFSSWDAATSQGHIDGWCDKIPNFSAIVLRNMQGTFKCRNKEPPKDYNARMLRAAGLADPWVPPPSGQKTPPAGDAEAELAELAAIYEQRGVAPDLARQVAEQMMAKDAFEAHGRDELGLASHVMARPVQAALTSAVTFAAGAALPLIVALLAPAGTAAWTVSLACLIGLAILGAIGARAGGASISKPTIRVVFWGAVAMASTALIGSVIGRAV